MKVKIQKEEYKRIISDEIEVDVPEKSKYYFRTGIRRAYAVIPVWTTWNKENHQKEEEIFALDVVSVDPTLHQIETYQIYITNLMDVFMNVENPLFDLLENILFYPDENVRTEDEFMQDYNTVREYISDKLKKRNGQ